MKVFKFYSEDLYYAYSGNNEEEAKETLFDEFGEMKIDKVEEIPESEWHIKNIHIWEDNDFETEPYLESIRDIMYGDASQLIFTNDISSF